MRGLTKTVAMAALVASVASPGLAQQAPAPAPKPAQATATATVKPLTMEDLRKLPDSFRQEVRGGSDVTSLMVAALSLFKRADTNHDGVIDQKDVDVTNAVYGASQRAAQVAMVLSYDLDGDGKVTRQEVIDTLNSGTAAFGQFREGGNVEATVQNVMRLDANGDGAVDYDEMRKVSPGQPQGNLVPGMNNGFGYGRGGRQQENVAASLLNFAGSNPLTPEGLLAKVRGLMPLYDANGDGVISQEEANAVNMSVMERMRQDGFQRQMPPQQ